MVPAHAGVVQGVDDVAAEAIDGCGDQAVVRAALVAEPRAQFGAGHRVRGAGDLPVVGPADDVAADGRRGSQHVVPLPLRDEVASFMRDSRRPPSRHFPHPS
ncbi:hypothetical protein [Streptomyces sp. NPDC051561]|uniref:hypothetical protein n=1 Tax=Streptomyces sp. NPDC051561 TaxID=3365658 RepID=UPI0037A89749